MLHHEAAYRLALITACLVYFARVPEMAAQSNYSRSTEIGPLRVSIDQLASVVEKAAHLVQIANGRTRVTREEMSLGAGTNRVKLSGHEIDSQRTRIPKVVNEFEYSIWFGDGAPVNHLQLSFGNFRRIISVDGESPDQVDALFATLRDEVTALTSVVGGAFVGEFVLSIAAPAALALIGIFSALLWLGSKRRFFMITEVMCFIVFVALLLLPTSEMFAGFSVIKGDTSFVVRYGAEIFSFCGLILGIFAICLSAVSLLRKPQRTSAKKQKSRR